MFMLACLDETYVGVLRMLVKFHGVRGSIPMPSPKTIRYGGNTSCYELVTDRYQFIFDSGTGFQSVKLLEDRTVIVLFTHFHHDHIQGLPFNFNLFIHKGEIILCSSLVNKGVLKNMIQTYFSGGYFPVDIVTMLTHLKFLNFATVRNMVKPELDIQTIELSHPGGSMGYKIKTEEGMFVYLQDNEYVQEQLPNLSDFVAGADFVIWDGMFTEAELEAKRGWGHSSIEQGLKFYNDADLSKLAICHHAPQRTDDELDELAKGFANPNVIFGHEGFELKI